MSKFKGEEWRIREREQALVDLQGKRPNRGHARLIRVIRDARAEAEATK